MAPHVRKYMTAECNASLPSNVASSMTDTTSCANHTKHSGALRAWLSRFLDGPYALPMLAFVGFLENTIIIFALEPIFLPAMASRGREAWKVAAALLVGNVIAGMAMYALGVWAADAFLESAMQNIGALDTYQNVTEQIANDGFWALFMVGVTPIPFQFGAAAAGAAGYSIIWFAIAVTISRAIRYFFEAGIIMAMGKRGQEWLECHELEIFLVGIGVFVGMVVMYFLI